MLSDWQSPNNLPSTNSAHVNSIVAVGVILIMVLMAVTQGTSKCMFTTPAVVSLVPRRTRPLVRGAVSWSAICRRCATMVRDHRVTRVAVETASVRHNLRFSFHMLHPFQQSLRSYVPWHRHCLAGYIAMNTVHTCTNMKSWALVNPRHKLMSVVQYCLRCMHRRRLCKENRTTDVQSFFHLLHTSCTIHRYT